MDFLYYLKTLERVSSTSGLVFLFYPVMALVGAFFVGVIALFVALFVHRGDRGKMAGVAWR